MKKIFITGIILLASASSMIANPVRGTLVSDGVVHGYSNKVFYETLYANETTNIDLIGDCAPGQDIDLWVYDENDNLVEKSTSLGCYESVNIDPAWTGSFKIVVENSNHPFDTVFTIKAY